MLDIFIMVLQSIFLKYFTYRQHTNTGNKNELFRNRILRNYDSGCESITTGNVKDPDAVYVFALLKLHAGEEGLIAGTEGFFR